jgi:hypothetical protein
MSFNQNNCNLNSIIAGALVHVVLHLNWRIKQHEDRQALKHRLNSQSGEHLHIKRTC